MANGEKTQAGFSEDPSKKPRQRAHLIRSKLITELSIASTWSTNTWKAEVHRASTRSCRARTIGFRNDSRSGSAGANAFSAPINGRDLGHLERIAI
jgi:hypothetical protein